MTPTFSRLSRSAARRFRGRRSPSSAAPLPSHVQPLESRVLMAADFRISEFMAGNVSTLTDEDAQYNDWIEIRNVGDAAGDLGGYRLTDAAAAPAKWTFPAGVTLPAGGHLVVFASGKDRTNPAATLHTNFSLNADGEYLALSAPDGSPRSTFAPAFPDQDEDISYGTDYAAASQPLRYFATPTPGAANARAEVVINEIHYDPDVKTQLVEFVELHNPGTAPVNLSGARFTEGITYTFAPGTTLAPGAYLLLAQNAAQFQAKYGVAPHGQYVGALSNDGEVVRLRNASGGTLDMVDYQPGFPWPTVGDAPGYSIELINPDFDNQVGGNWRAQLPVTGPGTTLFASNGSWRYFKGNADPSSDWKQVNAPGTNAWPTGNGPVGYDAGQPMGTTLSDMSGGYTSVYLRKTFNVADPLSIGALRLEAMFDDGFNVYLNGQHVYQQNVPSADMPRTGTASSAIEDNSYRPFNLPTGALRAGTNVIAVHFLNAGLSNSSDAFFDARLIATAGSGPSPSPGRRNSVHADNAAPQMRQVNHAPEQPRAGEVVTLTAKITDPDGVASASLLYQLVDPGSYIAIHDPAFATNWTSVAMRDDGTSGDAVAGDGIYTAQLPGSVQTNRRLVRYKITTTDARGASITAPYADDSVPNFAYFVYDGVPNYTAAARPGVTAPVTYGPEVMDSLPAYHLISKNADVENATWNSRYGGDNYQWKGTLVYDGVVYDHVGYRARGGVWRYAMVKNMWKFDFNHNHGFQARDDYGNKYPVTWDKLNLSAVIQQGNFWHRGEQGLFESVGMALFNKAGVPAPVTNFLQFRVIDNASENGTNQYTGDLWGLYLAVEQPDGNFLDQHGLPDGNLYKMEGGPGGTSAELNNQGPTQPTDKSDLNAFIAGYRTPGQTEQWFRDNMNLDSYYGYRAIVDAIHHYDIDESAGKNYFFYHNPVTDKWETTVWDLDLTWSDNMYGGGDEPFRDLIPPKPNLGIEYRNRVRELRDLLWNPEQTGALIDEMAAKIYTPGQPSFVDVDRAMWDWNPLMADPTKSSAPEKAGQGRFYAGGGGITIPAPGGFAGMIQKMKNYVVTRGTFLDNQAADAGVPARPTVTYVGAAGFPADALRFRTTNYSDPQGNPFAAMEWRLAEITDPTAPGFDPKAPRKYEIDALWESGELTTFNNEIVVPARYVEEGKTYRVRVRFKDSTGRWSNWSTAPTFTASAPDATVQDSLRITEIHYNPAPNAEGPPPSEELEFVELANVGPASINLAGVHFDNGIDYTFGDVTLAPGEYIVVAGNRASFLTRYNGPEYANINLAAGSFSNQLANNGERLVLLDVNNQVIHDFTYLDTWHPSTDGEGTSLVIRDPAGPLTAWGEVTGSGWRPSATVHGSPGRADDAPVDTTPPTVDILDVNPDLRNTAVGSITIEFSEPVIGFELSDLVLARDGGASLLTAAQTLASSDGGRTWTLGNLAGLTAAGGNYVLRLDAPGSGITDAAGNPLAAGATDNWTIDVAVPTADIIDVTPDPRSTPVDSIQIVFSEPVTGFDLADLRLVARNALNQENLLTAAQTLTTTDNRTFTLGNLGGLTGPLGGGYLLGLTAQSSGITDAAGNALAAGASDEWLTAAVFGRHLFYNNSSYDGRNPAAGAPDDGAIADKLALLPGAAASFANVSSYGFGINGIMVDIAGMPILQTRGPIASDFVFKAGNGGDPSTWATAPAPASVTLRQGAGVGGSDRITLTWANGAIRNTWLQVTVKANNITGLPSADVFYFGNLAAETGDSTTPWRVSALDLAGVRARLNQVVGIDDRFDINRDSRINALDLAAARAAMNNTLSPLNAPATAGAVVAAATSSFSDAVIAPPGTTAPLETSRAWDEEQKDLLK